MARPLLFLLSLLGWIYALMPGPAQKGMGTFFGFIVRILKVRAPVAQENLKRAFPGSEEKIVATRQKIFKENHRHLGQLFLEILMLLGNGRAMRFFVKHRVVINRLDILSQAMAHGKGVILLSSHTGNWEIMAATGGVRVGADLMIVTKRLKPTWLHEAIEKGRSHCGVRATYEPRTLKDSLRQLGKKNLLGIILDQYAGAPIGVRVPFFGIPVGTALGVAALARRTEAPVVPIFCHRSSGFWKSTWQIQVESPIQWISGKGAPRELAENTAQYVQCLEKHVRTAPHQWLWTHRRFKGDLSPLKDGEWDQARLRS